MRVLRVLGVVVVRRVTDFLIWIAVVPLAKLSAAVVVAVALGLRRAVFPVDVLARAVIIGNNGAATTVPPPLCQVAALACPARLHGLPRIHWLVFEAVLDVGAHLGQSSLDP